MPLLQNAHKITLKSHSSNESIDPMATNRVPVVGQKENAEEEILRTINEEVLDVLSPQPSIVSVLTDGLEHARTPLNSERADLWVQRRGGLC